jgi:hypothetical protein
MPTSKSLIEKARESAQRARARAHARLMSGGAEILNRTTENDVVENDVKKAVARAIARARQNQEVEQTGGQQQQEEEYDQEGGKKNKIADEKVAARKNALEGVLKSGEKLPSDKSIRNSMRTYKARVNGSDLGEFRYFKGTPQSAAKKVVASIYKNKDMNVVGIDNAVHIAMIEVSKGVYKYRRPNSKAPLERHVREYFGWREKYASPKITTRGGKRIEVNWENIAIPTRGMKTASASFETHNTVSSRVKANTKIAEARNRAINTPKGKTVASLYKEVPKKLRLK